MNRKIFIHSILMTFLLLTLSCEEDVEINKTKPDIQFKKSEGYTYSDATLKLNDSVKVGIIAVSNETHILTGFEVKQDQQIIENLGINEHILNVDMAIVKGTPSEETWRFIVKDEDGKADSVSLKLILEVK